jgi:hypothetical protein
MENKNTLEELETEIIYLPAPEGVDLAEVGELLSDDQYDIIFTQKGIVCSLERASDVRKAYKELQ